jgi:hypothetical protein
MVVVGRAGLRRRRSEGGRPHRVVVRFTDEELARVSARAEGARRTVPALLADLALTPVVGPSLDPVTARDLVLEVFAVRRGLEKVGRNVNDIARFALGTGEVRGNAAAVLAAMGPALARLDTFVAQVGEHFPGLELHR